MALSRTEITNLRDLSCRKLMAKALEIKLAKRGKKFSLCSIINAKSGKCSEDCSFCTQSAHHKTDTPVYSIQKTAEIVSAAKQAKKDGASHFSIVSSGREIDRKSLPKIAKIIAEIKEKVDIRVCASLGIGTVHDFEELKNAGLRRYHHNLETSQEFFPKVVSTHSFRDRTETIQAAQQAGLEVCAGGIIGLGESEEDRISMAQSLSELQVDSVPLNILIPLPGTPLEKVPKLGHHEILRCIALFRIILPNVTLRLAAGRESALSDFLGTAFMAGADGMMIGGYLTQGGRSAEADREFVEQIRKLWE